MIYIGLGANIQNKKNVSLIDSLNLAMEKIESFSIRILEKSSFFSSAPLPISDQPWFVNSVISVETALEPLSLLENLHTIERSFGRKRVQKWGPRTMDLDILSYKEIQMFEKISIPHPRMHERAFVLYPLKEISSNWIHPVLKKNVDQLIEELPSGQRIQKIIQNS